ncbi:hypothetical protein M378DRAFT_760973 [Amanita muscaria Koide BX008]|uniref:Uncharacterized protein n=1 Tax=Amanita muscaria (strain Koide BX008) TaxID=946122 RepID=A0A0C2T7C3_AMAMK|nr:hypothetical protein M378DRAFT_760973 [Amanita muscaria Koide BX008]
MSDAQNLVDFLVYLIDEKYILSCKPDGMSKAAQLVLNIWLWVPILPRSLFLNVERIAHHPSDNLARVQDACRPVLMWRVLDQNYIHLAIYLQGTSLLIPVGTGEKEKFKWQQLLHLDSITIIELVSLKSISMDALHIVYRRLRS